jgi:hypothetical protein
MPRLDTTPPVVNFVTPTSSGQTTSASVSISISGTDNKGVTRLIIYAKNNRTLETVTVAQQTYTASKSATRTLSGTYSFPGYGVYSITAKAFDAAGNSSTKEIAISYVSAISTTTTITPPPPPPTLPSSKVLIAPQVFNQGGEGSCLAMALSLTQSIEKYHINGDGSYSQSTNILSPEYLYNYTKVNSGCGSGSSMLASMGFLKNTGECKWSLCPYSDQNGCDTTGFTQAMADDAALNKIYGYFYTVGTDIFTLKRLLCNNHPITFSFQMDTNFYNAGFGNCNYIWNSRGDLMYTHAVTIIGYDDAKQAFLIQNSWGPSWGCNGRLWVDYAFFGTIAGYVYSMKTREDGNMYHIL